MTNQGLVPLAPHLSVAELIIGHGWRFQAGPISWKLVAGQTLWLQGANGSGKTTLLRVLATLKAPAAGNILWQEQDIAKQREVYRASLSWLGQADAVKANLTVAENLKSWGVNLDHPLVARFNITPLLSFWGGEISAGQRRRVALTRCLAKAAAL
ncbi:MAG: ATP-binding cassette domain-containing protein, partial [Dongiaceae bacterium]